MSSLTINKLKANIAFGLVQSNTSCNCSCSCSCSCSCCCCPKKEEPKFCCPGKPSPNTLTQTESSRISAKLDRCPVYYVDGVAIVSGKSTAPVLIETTPASSTTAQLIEATLIQSTTRFSKFFPRQPPLPQFLQPEFRKYKINSEPIGPQSSCHSFKPYFG